MTDQPADDQPAVEDDTPNVVPNRAERRGKNKKNVPLSKIPGQPHNTNVVKQRTFSNRRSGG